MGIKQQEGTMKKTIITIASGILLTIGSLSVPNLGESVAHASVETTQEATVKSAVNFRTSPSTSSKVLGTLSKGTKVEVIEQVNSNWVKIEAYDHTGYVSSKYLSIPDTTLATVKSAVNFRTSPSTSSRVLGTLPRGTEVEVIERVSSSWAKVEAKDHIGYVSTKYLTLSSSGQATEDTNQNTSSKSNTSTNVADRVIETGLNYLGTRYVYGARSGQTNTFDCSSFVQYIFRQNDIKLPRNSRQQSTVGETIMKKEELEKGDLIFFITGYRSDGKIDHVGVYMGDGKLLHSIPNGGVQVSNLSSYWLGKAVGAKRVIK